MTSQVSMMTSQMSLVTSHSLRHLILPLLLLFINTRESNAQCNGPPLYLAGHNSSGHIAFPEANFDPESGQWQSYQLYPTDVTCTWVLRAPQDHILAAAFLHFDTEKDYDYVTLYADEAKTEQLLQVSGDLDQDYFVTSPADTLVLEMVSDDYTTYGGFLLAYRYEPRACIEGGVTIAEDHLIAVPPRNLQGLLPGPTSQGRSELLAGEGWTWSPLTRYAPWLNCTWRLALDPRALLHLEIITFDTAPKDSLTIWQVNGRKSRQLLQYGGSDVPRSSFQSSKPLLVSFVSGNVDRGAGFLLNVTYIIRACEAKPQELVAPRGLLAYPLHNLQEEDWRTEGLATYGPDQCQWVVRAPHGYAINLTIQHFDTLPDDQLQILDGGSEVFTHGGGMPSRSNFVSRGSELTLKFNPERDTDHTGFLIHYSWLLRECGGKLPMENGEVRSPYYPDTYGASVNCTWTITPPQGHLVHLLLARLRLDQGDDLQVMSGGHIQQSWGAGQGSSGHLVELRPEPTVTVTFTSDKQLNLGYFMLKYQSFRPGSCDFSISPCGWQSTDPLQAWAFHGGSGRVVVQEQTNKNQQLPRGYRATLTSPWITPTQGSSEPSEIGVPMCFRLKYVLNGADAYLLQATLQQAETTMFGAKLRTIPLVTLHGPHGNASLTSAVNITVTGNFQISIIYERGYGPHYQAAISGVSVTEGLCGAEYDQVRAVSCNFTEGASFCAWANTHTDHTNWITDHHGHGLLALVTGSGGSGGSSSRRGKNSEHQWADLVSPVFNRSQLLEGEPGEDGSCFTLSYQLLTPNSELRVLVKSGDDEILKVAGGGHELAPGEQLLWAQGRVRSPQVLYAQVTLRNDFLAQQYQLVLRAVGVGAGIGGDESKGGVAVSGVEVSPGVCSGGPSCDFNKGFCSWRVSYTGGTVWYIRNNKDDDEPGMHAAVLVEGGPGDTTALTSEPISADGPVALAFRYKVVGTSKCLDVALEKGNGKGSGGSVEVIWEQCRGKGHQWLEECIHIPKQEEAFQVVIRADTGEVSTEVWLDDVNISAGGCNTTLPQELPYPSMDQLPQWGCTPHDSLCGMTQPLPGHRDWVYVYAPYHGIKNSTGEEDVGEDGEEIRRHSKRSSPNYSDYMDNPSALGIALMCRDGVTPLEETWICDGIEDCPDAADEEDCECLSPDASDGDAGTTCGNSLSSGAQGPGSNGMRRPANPQHLGSGVCAEGAFRCPSGRRDQGGAPLSPCLPRHMVCDNVVDCLAQEDEAACERMHRPAFINEMAYEQSTMVCSGGLNIPLAWRCDGIKDCPLDGLDEVGCAHCGSAEFICPTSGVCIPQQQVCDGAPSLPQCSDELMCDVCPPAHFVCDVCVTSWQICDGVWDCAMGEDERECHGVEPQETGGDSSGKCSSDQYRCPSGRCLPDAAVCDRRIDCPDGDDEKLCLDDNFDVDRYISVKPSPVAGSNLWNDAPSRLLTPTLSHPEGGIALLQFIYRLDAWLGSSNATLSLEVVDAENPTMGVSPWALWRQSGHKGRHWLKAKLLLPYRPNMQHYKLAFLVSNDEHPHGSQQLHIADISYRVVQPRVLHEIGRSFLQCEFEDSFCGWSQITTEHGYSWVYAKASPHTRRTGPITGYPDGSGSGFIFADSLHGSEGDVADLLSPPLILPHANATICFRFAMFLYGAHVAKVSVAALQRVGGSHQAPHTAELFHAKGAKGLSWIPVALQITAKDLGDPTRPFVLEVSATRGIGPEADIALDHVSIVSGGCSGDPVIEPERTLLPALDHDDVYALAAGPALMPQPKLPQTQVPSVAVAAPDDDPCAAHMSCSSCVTAGSLGCSWCDLSSLCVSDTTPHAAACPKPLHTQHNKSTGSRSGPVWCPQLAPKQNISVVVPARSSPVLAFPVINIQNSQMDSGWTCVYQFTDDDEGSSSTSLDNDGLREGHSDAGNKKLEKSMKKKEEVRMQGHYQSGSPGSTGVIKCGDGVTQLSPSHARPYATVSLSLVTPAGATLDNPRNVHVLVYDCSAMASSCTTCLTLNSSLACGWCPHTRSCRPKSQCISEWTDSVCSLAEETTTSTVRTTTEVSALNDLTEDLMDTHHDVNKDLKALVIEDMNSLLDSPEDDNEEEEEEPFRNNKRNKKTNKKKKKDMIKDKAHGFDNLEDDTELMGEVAAGTRDDSYQEDLLPDTKGMKTGGKLKKSGRNSVKGSIKVGNRGRAFLRLPRHPGIFVARDAWRLHTGRQYYVPVSKKTLINLGFVRQVTYGSLAEEKSRTVLINGAWKKAAGYFVDLFEKAGQDPVTSVVTTSRDVFEKLIGQLNTD